MPNWQCQSTEGYCFNRNSARLPLTLLKLCFSFKTYAATSPRYRSKVEIFGQTSKYPWVEFRSIGIGVRVSISFTYDWHDLGSTHIFRRLAKNAEPEATATHQRRPLLSAFSGCRQRRGQSLRKWQQPASDKPCRGRLGARNHGKSSLLVVQIPTQVVGIGVISGRKWGVRVPHFLKWEYSIPHF